MDARYGESTDRAPVTAHVEIERDTSLVARLRKLMVGHLGCAIVGNGTHGLQSAIASDPDLLLHAREFEILGKLCKSIGSRVWDKIGMIWRQANQG